MTSQRRHLLGVHERFAEVAATVARLGLPVLRSRPQVFPGRQEPAFVSWGTGTSPDIEFEYFVNPDRRYLWFAAGDTETAVLHRITTTRFDTVCAVLCGSDVNAAHNAAFAIGDLRHPQSGDVLAEAMTRISDAGGDAYALLGCVQALERMRDPRYASQLAALAQRSDVAPEVRLVAGEAASMLMTL